MKITLNVESAAMFFKAKQNSDLNFNQLIKEAMELLLLKYNGNSPSQPKDQNDQAIFTRTT